jgi:hypothetical protein
MARKKLEKPVRRSRRGRRLCHAFDGKLVWATLSHNRGNNTGCRQCRVEKAHIDPKEDQVDELTVRLWNGQGPVKHRGFCGRRYVIGRSEFTSAACGVLYRKKMMPVDEFYQIHGKPQKPKDVPAAKTEKPDTSGDDFPPEFRLTSDD